MAISHRNGDARACGGSTIVSGQDFVTIDGQLWAVEGDLNSHGDGGLIHSQDFVTINGKLAILNGDGAALDALLHPDPASSGSDAVSIGG